MQHALHGAWPPGLHGWRASACGGTFGSCLPPRLLRSSASTLRSFRSGSSRSQAATVGAAALLEPPTAGGQQASQRPSSAETARTVVDIVHHGTLSTVSDTGLPLGTYVTYVLDDFGQPLLRLRADAVHTRNLQRSPQCSLFVQPQDFPARLLARATLIGQVRPQVICFGSLGRFYALWVCASSVDFSQFHRGSSQ